MIRVRKLYLRALECGVRYWALGKDVRIKHGLRGDLFEYNAYYGDQVVKGAENALLAAMFHGFPVIYDDTQAVLAAYTDGQVRATDGSSITLDTPAALADYVGDRLDELEHLLQQAEADPTA
jgi:hypothetical protein